MAVSLGKGAAGNKAPAQNPDINVTPFIDILLVLLIIFMVALPPPTVNNNINMPPQNLNPPPPDPNNKPLFVSLGSDGSVMLSLGLAEDDMHAKVDNVTELPGQIVAMVPAGRATKETYIRADFDVPYKAVMELLNQMRQVGLKKIGLVGEATS
jgi:biopolymer transport protein ExbD